MPIFFFLFTLLAFPFESHASPCAVFDPQGQVVLLDREIDRLFSHLEEGDEVSGRTTPNPYIASVQGPPRPTRTDLKFFIQSRVEVKHQIAFLDVLKGMSPDQLHLFLKSTKKITRDQTEWTIFPLESLHFEAMNIVHGLLGPSNQYPNPLRGRTFQPGRVIGLKSTDSQKGWRYDIDPQGKPHINVFIYENSEKKVFRIDLSEIPEDRINLWLDHLNARF